MSASKPNVSIHIPNMPKKNPSIIYEVQGAQWAIEVDVIRKNFKFHDNVEWFNFTYAQAIHHLWNNSNAIKLTIKKYNTFDKKIKMIQRYVTNAYNNRRVSDIIGNSRYKLFFVIYASTKNNTNDMENLNNYYIISTGHPVKPYLSEGDAEFIEHTNKYLIKQKQIENNIVTTIPHGIQHIMRSMLSMGGSRTTKRTKKQKNTRKMPNNSRS
jgi:hypothetical protein